MSNPDLNLILKRLRGYEIVTPQILFAVGCHLGYLDTTIRMLNELLKNVRKSDRSGTAMAILENHCGSAVWESLHSLLMVSDMLTNGRLASTVIPRKKPMKSSTASENSRAQRPASISMVKTLGRAKRARTGKKSSRPSHSASNVINLKNRKYEKLPPL